MRFHQYLLDRALWIDEAFVAINLLNRDYGELLLPLDYNQGAPFGFLAIERLSIDLLGSQEWVLRLFPFVSSIIALFLFWRVADYFCGKVGLVVSLGLLALCDRAIYYGSELKQYSSDLMIAVLLYACLIQILSKSEPLTRSPSNEVRVNPAGWGGNVLFAAVGAIAVWISHPAVFVIAGTGLWLIGTALWDRRWGRSLKLSATFGVPAISFILFYLVSIRRLVDNAALQKSWSEGHNSFAPIPPTSLEDLKWLFAKFFEVFNYPVGISVTGIAALVFVIGCVALWREHHPSQSRQAFGLLLAPIAVTLLASALNQYPFKGQLLLFLVPIVLIVIGSGAAFLWRWGQRYGSTEFWLSRAIVALLFIYPVYHVALNLNNPNIPPSFEYQRVREDLKPVLAHIQKNWQPGDTLYVYYATQHSFRYYGEQYGFDLAEAIPDKTDDPYTGSWYEPALIAPPEPDASVVVGQYAREDWAIAQQEIDQLNGRVWALFSHAYDRRSPLDEEDVFLYFLDRNGTQIDSFQKTEAAAYLYQF